MKTRIRKLGNSQGVLIPKPLLAHLDFDTDVEMTVEADALVLRAPEKKPRHDWAQASQALAQAGDDSLEWPELSNTDDADLAW